MTLTHRIINERVCQKLIVHRFQLGDVEDPEIYAAGPIWDWQQSEAGQFVMENAAEPPTYHQHFDQFHYGYQFAITAWLAEPDATYFCLRWK
jgi:hypothetical protein